MRTIKMTPAMKLRSGVIALFAFTLLMSSCGSSHSTCPAYNGYHKKHRKHMVAETPNFNELEIKK